MPSIGPRTTRYTLNLETLPNASVAALDELDRTLVGTDAYLGIAYFWAFEYRHLLRDSSFAARRNAHAALRQAGLRLDAVSKSHERIIRRHANALH